MLENIDLLQYYSYGYKHLILPFDFIYLVCVKIWGWLDLKIRSYEVFSNRML